METVKCYICFQHIQSWRRMTESKDYLPEIGTWCKTSNSSKLHWGVTKDRAKYQLIRTLCGTTIVVRKEKKDG